MNQNRLTCLSTVVITAFLAPIATVCSKSAPALAVEPIGNEYQALARPLPIITPLTVTELETDPAVPTAGSTTPQPNRKVTVPNGRKVGQIPTIQSPLASSESVSKLPNLDTTFKFTAPVFSGSNFTDSFTPARQPVSTLPRKNPASPTPGSIGSLPSVNPSESIDTQIVKIRVVSPSVLVMRSAGAQFKAIVSSSTIEAETTGSTPVVSGATQMNSFPDSPVFVAGVPTFSFDTDRPQQIVATTVAEIGGTLAASQTSVTVPVERSEQFPNAETVPTTKFGKLIAYKSNSQPPQSVIERIVATHTGKASWYGAESGLKTANGERYNPNGLTAAHRTLPFGTKVRVTSLKTGKSVTLRINDRGPFHGNRILDVSAGAAEVIGLKRDGIGQIRMEVLSSKK